MLVLSRKRGERIVMPSLEVAVTVLGVEGNRVRLGISARKEIAVHREEAASRIRQSPPADDK